MTLPPANKTKRSGRIPSFVCLLEALEAISQTALGPGLRERGFV